MNYQIFDVEDFASDPYFRKWVLEPNEETIVFWENWIIQNPDKIDIIKDAQHLVRAVQFQEIQFKGAEKVNLLARIEGSIQKKETKQKHIVISHVQKSKNTFGYILKIAAVFIGVIAGASIFFIDLNRNQGNTTSQAESIINKKTESGQKLKIFLTDGSIVHLNSSSSIKYTQTFSGNKRELELSGEAFFEVAKDSLNPFIVKSGGLITTVYGTSFNINSYPDLDTVSVSLMTGKVTVEKVGSSEIFTLSPGESAGLNKKTGTIVKGTFDYRRVTLWKDGVLYFKETSIENVFNKLEQWYGVTIQYEKIPTDLKPINGRFNKESLDNVLMSLGHAVNFQYKIDSNEVFVEFKK